jgi:hypothetical protein
MHKTIYEIDIQQGLPRVVDWQAYIENLALPYEKGNIEGGIFTYDWIAYIWDIEICIWSVETTTMLTRFHSMREASRIFNVIRFRTNKGHFHFEPLQEIRETNININPISSLNKKIQRRKVYLFNV